MSTINIESGGKSIPIAKVGIIDSQEKILLGSLERDLVLQTLGNISIQAGNMFYKLSFDSSGNISTSNNNMVELQSLDNFSISSYDNGTFIFDLSTESLYLVYSKDLIPIAGVSASDYIYLSFINEQTLTGEQKQRLVLNSGAYVKSLNDVAYFSRADVYENQIIFVEDEKQHYILTDINNPNGKSAWTTFYIGMNGGIIYNGLEIQNTNRENLLHLNGVDDFTPGRFNGLKIGNSEKSVKLSVNTKNQTVIDSNTESLIIKTAKADILYYHDGNLGIYGEPATSDKYKIAINGTTKFSDSVFLERRLTSTDFITTNITHWDGGQGFGLIKTVNNKWFFECDDMVVRGSLVANKLKLKELEVERAYATGGHMLITDGADVDAVYYRLPTAEELETANIANNGNYGTLDANTYYYFITFKDSTEKDDSNAYVALDTTPNATTSTSGEGSSIEEDTLDAENYCPFINGDVLLCQTASGKSAKKYYCLVTYSTNKYAVVKANDFRNNIIYQYNELGEIVNVDTRFLVESGDTLIRVTNILYKNGIYEYKNRRRFIDIDGTRNQITMYDNLGDPNLFTSTPTEFNTYDDINIITGIGPNGALRLRMGELSDLNIPGLTGYGLYGDNVYLKGRLIVKTDDYEEIVGANRGSWVFGNLNKYYINDLVTYNGSVYRCIVEHQNTISSSSIPGVSDFWEIWVQKGTDGTPGSNFSYVDIVGDQVFIYNSGSGTYDKTVIPLTCTAFNVDYDSLINIKFEWVISGAVIYSHTYLKSEVTAGSISDSKNIYVTGINEGMDWSSLWNGDSSLTVSCRVYINDSTDYNSDVFSVYKVQNGADGETPLTGYITNDAISLSADTNNNVISYSYANGYFKVFYGLTDVTSGCTFSSTSINCTGSINTSGYYNVTDMTQAATIATLTLTATYNGTTITKEFSLSKSRTGSSAILYEVKPSVYTVTKSITNTFTPTSVVFSFYKTEGSSTVSYSGYYRTYSSTDGTVYSLITSSSGTSASVTPNSTYRSFKCELYTDSSYTTKVDEQSVLVVSDGATGLNSVNGVLTNDAVTVFAATDGTVSDFSYAAGTFKMYYGTTDVTASSTFSSTATNCTGSIASNGVYSITAFPAANNNGYLNLTGTYNGVSITRIFSISKSKTGSTGADAVIYEIQSSTSTIAKNISNVFSPTSVTFTFYRRYGSGNRSLFTGYYKTFYSTDGVNYTQISSTSGSSVSVTPGTSYRSIKCDLYSDSGYVNLVDSQTCLIVSDGNTGAAGQDAFTVILSNEAMTVPAMYSGAFPANIFSDYDYSSNVVVYRGSTKLNYAATSGYSYTVGLLTGSRFSTTISTSGTECKIRINNITQDLSGGLYIPDYMVANFYVSILYNNVATGTAFTKTIAVSKAKQGPLLDWIKEWDSNSTLVGSQYVISPKIFAGTNNGGSPTGVIVGRNAFNLTEIGVAGYYNGNNTFYLSALDGSFKFGQGNSSIVYNPSANTVTFGSNVSLNWTNYTDTAVNNVQVGGKNIIRNSFNWQDFSYWEGNGSTMSIVGIDGSNCMRLTGVYGVGQYIGKQLKPNTYYTFSAYARSSVDLPGGADQQLHIQIWRVEDTGNVHQDSAVNSDTNFSANVWKKAWYTFKTPASSELCYCRLYFYPLSSGTFDVRYCQLEEGNKPTDWSPCPDDVSNSILIAKNAADAAQIDADQAQYDANIANGKLSDLANDNKLTAVEKQQTKTEWDIIASEYSKITSQASTYGVDYSSYTNAYNALSSYITPLLGDLTTTSDIAGSTFRSNFKSYYDARTDLLNVIAIKAKTLAGNAQDAADNAQTSANNANSLLSDMSNDGKLTSVEKQQIKLEWDGINAEYQKNANQAYAFGQDYTAYYNAYNGLNGYLSPLLSNLASTSDINGTTFRSYFSSYYAARTDLLNAISIAAKSQAISTASDDATDKSNTAYTNAKNYVDANYVNNTTYSNGIAGAVNKADDARETALAMAFGRMVYRDPMFIDGLNGLSVYNNNGGSAVTLTRIGSLSGCPNPYGYAVQIHYDGGSVSPGLGGFTFQTQSRAGAIFITRFIAKIPVGYSLVFASNPFGDGGSSKWLSNSVGTGVWTEYAYKVTCGSSGTFSSTNFFYLNGSGAVTWYLAYATVFDITAGEKYTTTIDENGIYTGTLTALQVNAVAINANSITTGTLSADRIAANSLTANHIQTNTITTLGNVTAGSFNLGNGKFIVDSNGNLTSTSGLIGGWKIDSNKIKYEVYDGEGVLSNYIHLDSSLGKIELFSDQYYDPNGSVYNNSNAKITLTSYDGSLQIIDPSTSNQVNMSPAGMYVNGVGSSYISASTGFDWRCSIGGMGFVSTVRNSSDMNRTIRSAISGKISNSSYDPCPSFGGHFERLRVDGLNLNTKYQTSSGLYVSEIDTFIQCTSGDILVNYLPNTRIVGTTILMKCNGSGALRTYVYPGGGYYIYDDNSSNSYYDTDTGWLSVFILCQGIDGYPSRYYWSVNQMSYR